jgi:peptidoglycan hydrolase CwlO-like protein
MITIDPSLILSSIITGSVVFIFRKIFYLNHKVSEVSTKVNDLKKDVDSFRQNLQYLTERIDKIYELLIQMSNNIKKK